MKTTGGDSVLKTVRINFSDFWRGFNPNDNFLINVLRERYDVQICDDPDYLFFSCFGLDHTPFDGVKIFYTGEDVSPDFNFCDYAIGFDEMQFGDRYLRYPIFTHRKGFAEAKVKHLVTDEDIAQKDRFCNFVYSNKKANPIRAQFFETLSQQYKHVDSGGGYLNNVGGPVPNKLAFQKHYKFSIAFENDKSEGYTTEKITDAFAAKTVPIYWGNPHVTRDFNPKAFINCNDYDTFDEVIERIKEVDEDDALFRAMLEEPIFTPENHPERFSEDRLREFLFAIFDQPLESAGRRSRYSWQRFIVEDQQKIVAKVMRLENNKFLRKMRSVYHRMKRILQKVRK